jgi:hypothetical protein
MPYIENDICETYDEVLKGPFPYHSSFSPTIWGNSYQHFVPQIFAIYNQTKNRFVLYIITNMVSKFVVKPFHSNRDEPFYLKIENDPTSLSDCYKIPVHDSNNSFNISFANAWLCSKNITELKSQVPVMHVSENDSIFTSGDLFEHKVYSNPINVETIKNYIEKYKTVNLEIISDIKSIPFDIPIVNPHLLSNNQILSSIIQHVTNNSESKKTKDILDCIKPIPKYIAGVLVKNAIDKEECCPITMETLTDESATITSCFHVFEKSAIETWLNDEKNHSKCPVCKQVCKI